MFRRPKSAACLSTGTESGDSRLSPGGAAARLSIAKHAAIPQSANPTKTRGLEISDSESIFFRMGNVSFETCTSEIACFELDSSDSAGMAVLERRFNERNICVKY